MSWMQLLKRTYIIVFKLLLQLAYSTLSSFKKTDNKKVVIALYRTNELDDNLKFISNEINKQLPDAKIHLVFGENKMNLKLFKEIVKLSDARYLILDDYYLPIYLVNLKGNLKVIQLWHAAGALKKFGYSTVGTKFGPNNAYLDLVPIHSNYTHVYISAAKFTNYYAEAFNMDPSRIYPLGVPRTDLFNNKELCNLTKEKIYKDYPVLDKSGFVNILIAPTYRAQGIYLESPLEVLDSVINIASLLNNNIKIIFKPHPYMKEEEIERLQECRNVIIVNEYPINEWMLIADAFITDYSSAIFEFSLLKKPMAHFVPDKKQYGQNRGFYQELEISSDGTILQNDFQLKEWINAREYNQHFDSSRMIKYNFDKTENVSREIVKHFISE